MLFGDKLKLLRKENNLTQEELAFKLNVSRQAITKWECNEGIPDIDNLKEISKLFNTTIDELVKEEKAINIEKIKKYIYTKELEINHTKHFDINISKINELNIRNNKEEIIKIELSSNEEEHLEELYKVSLDDVYNKLDIDIKSKKEIKDISINLYIPEKYINDIELNSNIKYLNINNIELNKLEYDGELISITTFSSLHGKIFISLF